MPSPLRKPVTAPPPPPVVSPRSRGVDGTGPVRFELDADLPEAEAWARARAGELITGVTETSRTRIRGIVADAFQNNIPPLVAAQSILDVLDDVTNDPDNADNASRSEMIARTETLRAVNEGQRLAWDQAVNDGFLQGDEEQEWITTDDDRLCPICEPLDGVHATLGEQFVDGEGDEIDGPPAHPNCRCTIGLAAPQADLEVAGGQGSGNFGHAGRPGEQGGSAEGLPDKPLLLKPGESFDIRKINDRRYLFNPDTNRLILGAEITPNDRFTGKDESHAELLDMALGLSPTNNVRERGALYDSYRVHGFMGTNLKFFNEKNDAGTVYLYYPTFHDRLATPDDRAQHEDNIGKLLEKLVGSGHVTGNTELRGYVEGTLKDGQYGYLVKSKARAAAERFFKWLGGKGSGNFGHTGRPGEQGGSASENISSARKDVLESGLATGKERLLVLDGTDARIHDSSGTVMSVAFTPELKAQLEDPSQRLTLIHNHPQSQSLSGEDIANFVRSPGMFRIEAVAHDGSVYSAERGPNWKVGKTSSGNILGGTTEKLYTKTYDDVRESLLKSRDADQLTHPMQNTLDTIVDHTTMLALDRLGHIKYQAEPSEKMAETFQQNQEAIQRASRQRLRVSAHWDHTVALVRQLAFNPDEPRDEKGRWSLEDFVGDGSLPRPKVLMGDHPGTPKQIGDYLEAHGSEHEAQALPAEFHQGKANLCYQNATQVVLSDPNRFDYAEGIGYNKDLPEMGFLHAWAIDKETNKVIDTTWPHPEDNKYFGVRYPAHEYLKYIVKTKFYGILGGQNKDGARVLREGNLNWKKPSKKS